MLGTRQVISFLSSPFLLPFLNVQKGFSHRHRHFPDDSNLASSSCQHPTMSSLDNANPTVHSTSKAKSIPSSHDLFSSDKSTYWHDTSESEDEEELLDSDEIFGMALCLCPVCKLRRVVDLIRGITDPERALAMAISKLD